MIECNEQSQHGPLIVVANRLPIHHDPREGWVRSPGGLVTALSAVVERTGGAWVGWNDSEVGERLPNSRLQLIPFDLNRVERERFYLGYANSALWPLLHGMPDRVRVEPGWFNGYRDVNAKVADLILGSLPSGPARVWIHDYHFLLLPEMLRRRREALTIGVFLHTPVPCSTAWSALADSDEIVSSLAAADLVGTQRVGDSENLRSAFDGLACTGRVDVFPISIDPQQFLRLAEDPATRSLAARYRARWGDRHVFLGVDRLDYTKGIPARLEAFMSLLAEDHDRGRDGVALVQIASPSRETIAEYRGERIRIRALAGKAAGIGAVNGDVVDVIERSLTAREVVAHYLASDTMLVTPLRDGMNLVAKEFAICRQGHGGLLVLSRTAGAADELSSALLVDPNPADIAQAMSQALAMPCEERRRRATNLYAEAARSTVHDWAEAFLTELTAPFAAAPRQLAK